MFSTPLAFTTPLSSPVVCPSARNGSNAPTCQASPPSRQDVREQSRIKIFDTTLRDGELSTGVSFSHEDKLRIAHQLYLLGVDVIEAGFPALYSSDVSSLTQISREVGNQENPPSICALARANQKDIQVSYESIQDALFPRVHIFLTTSRPQSTSPSEWYGSSLLRKAESAVRYAKSLCADVEFSAADAFRSDRNLLAEIIDCAIQAGATTISIPDTYGTSLPSEISSLFNFVRQQANQVKDVTFSIHAHNDLGLAVANSLSAIQSGARQVEVSVNGIGARAGNASLEEVAMALFVRREAFRDILSADGEQFIEQLTNIRRHHLIETSRMVSKRSGIIVQANKAIVGANASSFIYPDRT
ncbi:2-isopropylmalate synthase [Gracilaria domingensis]|nr:2-isopropylmalate synthase [Gracilaria domingensis]